MGALRGWAFLYALFTAVLLPIPYYALIPIKVRTSGRANAVTAVTEHIKLALLLSTAVITAQ